MAGSNESNKKDTLLEYLQKNIGGPILRDVMYILPTSVLLASVTNRYLFQMEASNLAAYFTAKANNQEIKTSPAQILQQIMVTTLTNPIRTAVSVFQFACALTRSFICRAVDSIAYSIRGETVQNLATPKPSGLIASGFKMLLTLPFIIPELAIRAIALPIAKAVDTVLQGVFSFIGNLFRSKQSAADKSTTSDATISKHLQKESFGKDNVGPSVEIELGDLRNPKSPEQSMNKEEPTQKPHSRPPTQPASPEVETDSPSAKKLIDMFEKQGAPIFGSHEDAAKRSKEIREERNKTAANDPEDTQRSNRPRNN